MIRFSDSFPSICSCCKKPQQKVQSIEFKVGKVWLPMIYNVKTKYVGGNLIYLDSSEYCICDTCIKDNAGIVMSVFTLHNIKALETEIKAKIELHKSSTRNPKYRKRKKHANVKNKSRSRTPNLRT